MLYEFTKANFDRLPGILILFFLNKEEHNFSIMNQRNSMSLLGNLSMVISTFTSSERNMHRFL